MICFSGARIEPKERFPEFQGVPGITDIALGLGRTPRFGGQTRRWWCGIHHALVCADIAIMLQYSERLQFLCLTHDAHEALTGDTPAFFKPPKLAKWQKEIDKRLFSEWGVWPISKAEHEAVKLVDDIALRAEASVVGPPGIMAHFREPQPNAVDAVCNWLGKLPTANDTDGLESEGAKMFYTRYADLIGAAVHRRRDDTKR